MSIAIERGENFCCQTFGDLSLPEELTNHREIAPKIWAGRGLPVVPEEHWEKWLGEISLRGMRNGLVLTAVGRQPEVGQIVNEQLKRKVDNLVYGLILQGVPDFRETFSISGANENGEAVARQFGRMRWVFYPTREMRALGVTSEVLARAALLAHKIEVINQQGPDWRRLRRAVETLIRGSAELSLQDERIHQFARSLEGLILPDIGATRKQFVKRCQTFATPNPAVSDVLGQIFDIRSKLEHLHNALDVMPGSTRSEKENLLYRRARQADALARFALSRALESDALREVFRCASNILAFWNRSDSERSAIWGSMLDVQSIS